MSFFDDILKNFELKNFVDEIVVTLVIGVGIMVVGNIYISDFTTDEISLSFKNECYKIVGNNLKLKSMSKGEIVVLGDVLSFVRG